MSLERGDQGLKEPTYGLGDKFLPFRLPLREWTGYGSPFTMQKALHSSILLQTDEIPNLRFFTVIENEEWWKTDVEWKIWIEADKRQLRRLGMIKQTGRNFAGVTDITDLELLHEFNPEALDKVSSLRVTMWVPEGEYIAAPDPRSLEEGELKFDIFTKIGGNRSGFAKGIYSSSVSEKFSTFVVLGFQPRTIKVLETPERLRLESLKIRLNG